MVVSFRADGHRLKIDCRSAWASPRLFPAVLRLAHRSTPPAQASLGASIVFFKTLRVKCDKQKREAECTVKKEVAQNLVIYFRYFVFCWSNGRNICGTFHYFKKTFLFLEWERGGVGGWRDNDAGCANALVK